MFITGGAESGFDWSRCRGTSEEARSSLFFSGFARVRAASFVLFSWQRLGEGAKGSQQESKYYFAVARGSERINECVGTSSGSERIRKQSRTAVGRSLPLPLLTLHLLESLSTQTEVISAVALIIYTKPGCPYCQQARDYYNSKGITFIDRDAQNSKEFRAEMFKYSGGDPTVPCIVKDGKYVQSGWGDPLRG